jgi:hypothetical protein
MKINASLLLSAYLLTHVSVLWATPIQEIDRTLEESNHPSLLHLPPKVLEHVVSYAIGSGQSIDSGALALRGTCHALKSIVQDMYLRNMYLRKSFNSLLTNAGEDSLECTSPPPFDTRGLFTLTSIHSECTSLITFDATRH